MEQLGARVLLVDDDEDIASLVRDLLMDEGYAVDILTDVGFESVQEAVAKCEPDCVLLDGSSSSGYGESWDSAAWLASRTPAVPVLMFTAHAQVIAEATSNTSGRSQAASFTGLLSKPFELDELIRLVSLAVKRAYATTKLQLR